MSYKMSRQIIFIFLIILTIGGCTELGRTQFISNNCSMRKTCSECIQSIDCDWCYELFDNNNSTSYEPQCVSSPSIRCANGYNGNIEKPIEITNYEHPERFIVKLKKNMPISLTLNPIQLGESPVDLYFIINLLNPDDFTKNKMLVWITNFTNLKIFTNMRFGFGAIVSQKNCENCTNTYGFKHYMSLNPDVHVVIEAIKNAEISNVMNTSDFGSNAILQSLLCHQHVGWRAKSKNILIYVTNNNILNVTDEKVEDAPGKDNHCHLDYNSMYIHSNLQHPPSLNKFNEIVKKYETSIIFVVSYNLMADYSKLTSKIQSSSLASFAMDSSNVLELVKDNYVKIPRSIEIQDKSTSPIQINYCSACLGGDTIATNKCEGMHDFDRIIFTAEIVFTTCPTNRSEWFQSFEIYSSGNDKSFMIDVEMMCECPRERVGDQMFHSFSPTCSNFGHYKCGICECVENHFGKNCEFSLLNPQSAIDGNYECRANNYTHDCSGRGYCVLGVCKCFKRLNSNEIVSGKFCECDNFSCDRHNQSLCSGKGTCQCGECVCDPGWTGSACECQTLNTCKPPSGGETCSGHGECICGSCRCHDSEEGRYSGNYCEKCPTCPENVNSE